MARDEDLAKACDAYHDWSEWKAQRFIDDSYINPGRVELSPEELEDFHFHLLLATTGLAAVESRRKSVIAVRISDTLHAAELAAEAGGDPEEILKPREGKPVTAASFGDTTVIPTRESYPKIGLFFGAYQALVGDWIEDTRAFVADRRP